MTRFLKILWNRLRGFLVDGHDGNTIAPKERITRFILSRTHFSKQNARAKVAAFLPPPNLQMSVYRTETVDEAAIWEIGGKYVAKPQDRTIRARGDLLAGVILQVGLKVVPDTKPHKLHANIVGWPNAKDEQRMIAVELANAATLRVPPT
jgi:hypothetical protein